MNRPIPRPKGTGDPRLQHGPPSAIKVQTGYGRVYVSGPGYRHAYRLPGAALNERRNSVELSLTLDTLRRLRKMSGTTPQEFAKFCTPEVLAWAKAAGRSERLVDELHSQLDGGFRIDLPWEDARARTTAPAGANPAEIEFDDDGVWWYKYRAPFEHQRVMATVACSLDGSSFICDMGTGKTRAGIEAARFHLDNSTLEIVVVVCPKGVIPTWQREVKNWASHLQVETLEGPVKQRAARLGQLMKVPTSGRVVVVNYDVLYMLKDDLIKLAKNKKVGLLLDEGHRIRNPQTKTAKAALSIAQTVKWRLHMTGTPILQGAHDIWSQWYVVDMGIAFGANFTQFRREFFNEDAYEMTMDPKDGALDEIGMRLRKRGLRYTKADCLDLPPKMYEVLELEMPSEQLRAYKEMEVELIAYLEAMTADADDDDGDERVATAANQLAAILRLTQITSGFVPDENGEIHRFRPNPKLEAVEEIVREQIGSQQIIVWARYREDVRAIAERLGGLSPVLIQGGQTSQDRAAAEEWFQSGQSRLLIANPAAGGVGLNLQAASLAIYYSQGYSLEHRLQSEDRCHRSGSEIHNRVTYIDLVMKDSIDLVIAEALAGKKSVAECVVDLKHMLGVET